MKKSERNLPPGFRFHPTDEELILHYLRKRASSCPVPVAIVAEVDIYKFDPWDLPAKAAFGEKEWYFFSPRDRKYPNGARPNRAAASGYWKATGTDKSIATSLGAQHHITIGVKKALVFYKGRPPKGVKTNWIMHEYRLSDSNIPKPNIVRDSSMRLDDWVLCRIYKKTNALVHAPPRDQDEEVLPLQPQKSSSFSNLLDAVDYSMLTSLLSDCPTTSNTITNASTGLEYDQAPGSGGSLDQTYFSGCPINTATNNNYVMHKLPQMHFSSNKRQLPSHEDDLLSPSKRYLTSCSFMQSNIPLQTQSNINMNPMFFDHQFFLSPEL